MQSHDHEPKPGTHNLAAVVSPLSLLEKPQKDLKFNATTPHTVYLGKVASSMKGCSHLKAELNIVLNAKKDSANAGFGCEIVNGQSRRPVCEGSLDVQNHPVSPHTSTPPSSNFLILTCGDKFSVFSQHSKHSKQGVRASQNRKERNIEEIWGRESKNILMFFQIKILTQTPPMAFFVDAL